MGKSCCFTLDEHPEIIVCAFTISNDSIKTLLLPRSRKDKVIKAIPRQKHMRSYPAVLIGRLGVHKNYRQFGDDEQRVGDQLMDFIKAWFVDNANKTGCRFIVVDAYNEQRPLHYYKKNGFVELFSTEEQEKEYTDLPKEKEIDDLDYGMQTYYILECCGCESISFRTEYIDYLKAQYEETDVNADSNKTIAIYPKQLKNRKELSSIYYLPARIQDVYEQTILALKGDSRLLAAVGFRAILEAICIEEKIKGQNLEQKINNLVKNRLITEKEAERLHTIRFLGNDSVHEMEIPSDKRLYLVLDIIEHLLNN
ncbi:hypothetical protein A9P82_05740 [Arachidicoccus ginsenosidimutans]|nr:hypothetical protein A9P82_05740 [Arachidicoccus sp. BS20]